MSSSRIVAVRSALIAGLDALGSLDNVEVSYAYKFGSTERERIFTGRARGPHTSASLKAGRNFRNERITFDLVVLVESVGGTAEEADTRAIALGQIVEEYVADNKAGLGVSGLNWLTMSGFELNNLANDRGTLSEITYQITYDARLT